MGLLSFLFHSISNFDNENSQKRSKTKMASISKQSKETQDRHRKMLAELLKRPENHECMDCRARNPTWASINLGVFLCIRCSGLHRQVGVHITQVRSCTMDLWEPHQIAFMQSMGNAKARAIWEATLPHDYGKPSENEDSQLVLQWIRTKYEKKRYYNASGGEAFDKGRVEATPLTVSQAKVSKKKKEKNTDPSDGASPASVPPVASVHNPPASPVNEFSYDQFMSPVVQSPRGPSDSPAPSAFSFVNHDDGPSQFAFVAQTSADAAPTAFQEVPLVVDDATGTQTAASAFSFLNCASAPQEAEIAVVAPPIEESPVTAGESAFSFIAAPSPSAPEATPQADPAAARPALPHDSLLVFDEDVTQRRYPPLIHGHFLSPEPPVNKGIVFDPFENDAHTAQASAQPLTQSTPIVAQNAGAVTTSGTATEVTEVPLALPSDQNALLLAMQQQLQQQMLLLQQQLAAAQLQQQ